MSQFVQWLAVLEVLGFAVLPLTFWAFRWLPDRGYIFTKALGLLIVTYLTWVVGMVLPLAGSAILPLLLLLAVAVAGWWTWRGATVRILREVARPAIVEESLFLVALVVWTLLRVSVFDSAIAHTEQFMDMAFLNGSLRSASYPPYDPWMSGNAINYYYLGYLMVATLTKLSGVAPTVGYNLAISTIFALTVASSYAIGYALTRRYLWTALAPLFVALLGNWHAVLWQLPHASCPGSAQPGFWGWLWEGTRVVGGHFTLNNWACAPATAPPTNDYTINEFPLFSFVLGDLHPHVMALPFILLVLALAYDAVCNQGIASSDLSLRVAPRLLLIALCVGALFTINSWDYPTFLLVTLAALTAHAYLTDPSVHWWRKAVFPICAVTIASLVLYIPFYVRFHSLAHGIGLVSTPTDLYEYIQVFGFFLLACGALVGSLGYLLRPAGQEEETAADEEIAHPVFSEFGRAAVGRMGADTLVLVGLVAIVFVVGGVLHWWTLLLVLALGLGAATLLHRVLNTETPNRSDAVALIFIVAACFVLALTEIIYLRDAFDGSSSYRMNTVFKFYYEAWVLLGLAGSYGVYRTWLVLRRLSHPALAAGAMGVLALGAIGAGVYTRFVPAYAVSSYGVRSLDGMAWIQQAHPDDYAGIRWLQTHVHGQPVVLEAVGDDYSYSARVSTFTGLPTVMGWVGHEGQWRPGNTDIAARASDVRTIYTSRSAATAEQLLRRYHVRYVFVGDQERASYGDNGRVVGAFSHFMRVVFRSPAGRTVIYTW